MRPVPVPSSTSLQELLRSAIIGALKDLDKPIPEDLGTLQTPLLGNGAVLDSLGLVTVLVEMEQAILDRWGLAIDLVNEKAFLQTDSPFRTMASLTAYLERQIRAQSLARGNARSRQVNSG